MAGLLPMQSTSPKKPSPLSFGAQRSSPFKRPDSPFATSQSNLRPTTPTSRPSFTAQIPNLTLQSNPPSPATSTTSTVIQGKSDPPRQNLERQAPLPAAEPVRNYDPQPIQTTSALTPQSSTNNVSAPSRPATRPTMQRTNTNSDPISKLHPSQLRDMRESFQVMDRDNDGQVNREDIAEVLTQLGLDASVPSLTPYFPPSAPPNLNLSTYLNMLSTMLADLSRHDELTAAFSAFDVDDSGQIDIDELRDALMHTNPGPGKRSLTARDLDEVFEEFSSRRTLAKGMAGKEAGRRGEVFRYMDFMSEIRGANKNGQGSQEGVVQGAMA